ncbi:Prefoldin subunit 3 [Phytophthora pseudosyringae]|uniref:Prefoldin subunit 3 n=1 Tax=Phytophthora pseudosyringae TaxID=221518 RepID=A0A8T1W2E5_9STRA|nr:Prefoldin subunit 3 [Phytophthora pseudosyringae]
MASSAPTPTGLESPEALARLNAAIMGERNPRGIPSAVFVDSVDAFMDVCGVKNIEPLVGALQQMYSKYKFMETSLQKNRETFKRKIPDTQKDLNMVRHLVAKRDEGETLQTQFNLADNVYAKASVDCNVGKVCIWLGAQVMVEYPYEEAQELLEENVATATEKLVSRAADRGPYGGVQCIFDGFAAQVEEDLSFLRDQIITSEVNIARIFNHDVRRRRQEKDDKLVAELEAK